MDALRPETLHKLERNVPILTKITLGHAHNSIGADHFARLGNAIATNTHLKELEVDVYRSALKDTEVDLFDGIKQNSSIYSLKLICGSRNIVGSAAHEILKAYHEDNNLLNHFTIEHAGLQNGGHLVVANTLRCCKNLRLINLSCDITDELLLPIVESVRGHTLISDLYLGRNRIGNAGGEAIATLLREPNNNFQYLDFSYNQIGDDGAVAIANSLANNTKLKCIYLPNNSLGQKVMDIFSKVLCDKSSINATYSSNHTLIDLAFSFRLKPLLFTLLILNQGTNKNHVAIKKILQYHPNIDMEPLFELDEGRERTLKGLPLIIDWFERAKEAVVNDSGSYDYQVEKKKLSAIYQFAQAMPELFIPTEHTKERKAKRKR